MRLPTGCGSPRAAADGLGLCFCVPRAPAPGTYTCTCTTHPSRATRLSLLPPLRAPPGAAGALREGHSPGCRRPASPLRTWPASTRHRQPVSKTSQQPPYSIFCTCMHVPPTRSAPLSLSLSLLSSSPPRRLLAPALKRRTSMAYDDTLSGNLIVAGPWRPVGFQLGAGDTTQAMIGTTSSIAEAIKHPQILSNQPAHGTANAATVASYVSRGACVPG